MMATDRHWRTALNDHCALARPARNQAFSTGAFAHSGARRRSAGNIPRAPAPPRRRAPPRSATLPPAARA